MLLRHFTISVSYTHLDVYKRQLACTPNERTLRQLNLIWGCTPMYIGLEKKSINALFDDIAEKALVEGISKNGDLMVFTGGTPLGTTGSTNTIKVGIVGNKMCIRDRYTHPLLEPILRNTYGCIVYQEQVMQIVQELAGYSLGRSDMVRRAMSKKKADVMAKERENFINGLGDSVPGCVKNGISANIANTIFDEMTDFAKYAFNKSHAACYAVVAYQTAWLKTHYPAEFLSLIHISL